MPGGLGGVLGIVQRHFPNVNKVQDATKNLTIEVTNDDDKKSKRRNMNECAMAVACKRAYKADGVILSRKVAYLVKGDLAIRFIIPESVAREITSFDRGAGFAPGSYHLHRPPKGRTLEHKKAHRKSTPDKNIGEKHQFHLTTGIRAVLGSVDDKG